MENTQDNGNQAAVGKPGNNGRIVYRGVNELNRPAHISNNQRTLPEEKPRPCRSFFYFFSLYCVSSKLRRRKLREQRGAVIRHWPLLKKNSPPLPVPPLPPPKITAHMYIFCLGNNSGRALGGAGKETQQPLFTVIITSSSPSPSPNPARLRPALFTRSSTFTLHLGGSVSSNPNFLQLR